MKTKIVLLTCAALIAGCSSVSDSIPTVKIEKRKPQTTVQSASYIAQPTTNHSVASLPKEAAMLCDTDDMRRKVIDNDSSNDSVRLMVVQDSNAGSHVLSEVEVDCRDYFLRKSLAPSQPAITQASTPQITRTPSETRSTRKANTHRYTYIVQKGDTVWDIAREHCTTVKDVSRLNGLGRGNILDIGQRLKLPDVECD